jgi:hypothetical protein
MAIPGTVGLVSFCGCHLHPTFPAIYRKATDKNAPLIVARGPIFAAGLGLGWQLLSGTILKATTGK